MRKVILVFGLIFLHHLVKSQSPQLKEIWKLYDKKKYDEVIEKGEKLLEKSPGHIEYNFWVGRAYFKKEKVKEAKPFLEKASMHNDPHSTIKARANYYLGVCYFLEDEKEKAKQVLNEGKAIYTYKNYTEANEYWIEKLGFDDFYNNWSRFETQHFRFYFQDTTDINHKRFINDCEKAFVNIDTFFASKLPKKIDYYVWSSHVDARNVIKHDLSFAHTELCLIHGGNYESEGHEIAHIVSYFSNEKVKKMAFVSEGTAVYFDQTNLDREQWIKGVIKGYKIKKVDIKDLWKNWYNYPSKYSYSIAGLFIENVIKKYGQEKYLEFYTDHSYKHAQQVFGKDFESFIKEFEAKYNR